MSLPRSMRVRVLLNPKAGSGSAARQLPLVLSELERAGASVDSAETQGPGDAARLVREAQRDRVDCVAVMGGDGTFNEVTQAYLGPDGQPIEGPTLGIIPAGTGGDLRRTFGLGLSVEEAVTRLMTSPPRPVDLGILSLTDPRGAAVWRAFANVASFGISGLTDRLVATGPKWMGGRAAFFLATLQATALYRNLPVRVIVDGELLFEGPIFNVALANGRYFGGGMKIAPDADPADGALDVVAMGDLSWFQSVSLTRHIYQGTHVGVDGIRVARGRSVRAEPLTTRDEVLIDMDGETPGRLPLEARVERAGLKIRI